MRSSETGGFSWNEPATGLKSKNVPRDPKYPSEKQRKFKLGILFGIQQQSPSLPVSGKAEQNCLK